MDDKLRELAIKRARQYAVDPKLWVKDTFGDNVGLSNQQMECLDELGKLIKAKLKYSCNATMTEEEELYARKIGISISSGKGTGKDFMASLLKMFFLDVFHEPRVLGTANTAQQLKNVLWAQTSQIMRLSRLIDPNRPYHPKDNPTILEYKFEWQAEKIIHKALKGQSWFAEAVTVSPHAASEEQAKTLTGRHADYMLFVVDEAVGIPEPALKAMEETLTGMVNLIFMIFNPFRTRGFAIESQTKDRDKWVCLRWNAEDTIFPNENMNRALKSRNEYLLEKYGRESNPYRIQVLGLPPIAGADTLIPYDWIMDAIDREITPDEFDPIITGVDPAAGGDKSVIIHRKGGKVYKPVRFNLPDTMDFTGKVVTEINKVQSSATMVDPIGVGKGVYDRLREQGHRVYAVDVRRTPKNPERFDKLRDELWWKCRKMFEDGTISIPNDQELIDQLAAVKRGETTSSGKEKIAPKKELKKELQGDSPDEADALCLTLAYDDAIFRKASPQEYDKYERKEDEENYGQTTWMSM